MEDREKILAVANELRDCLGCAYGCCHSASVLLADLLRRAGLKATVYKGTFRTDLPADEDGPENGGDALHFWVLCEGFLVDITADQFNDELDGEEMPGVYCEPAKTALWRYGKGKDVRGNLTPKILDHVFRGRERMGDIRVNETMAELRQFAGALSARVRLGEPQEVGGTRP